MIANNVSLDEFNKFVGPPLPWRDAPPLLIRHQQHPTEPLGMALLTTSFCRGAARLLAIDARMILGLSYSSSTASSNLVKHDHRPFHRHTQYWPSAFAVAVAAHARAQGRSRYTSGEIVINRDDPNNQAFDLMSNHGFGIEDARSYTQASISYQGF